MKEEEVTKAILKHLIDNKWEIVCYDFPQSGTGKLLHKNGSENQKNKNSINPDIVCCKNGLCLYFENKDRYYYDDFVKINELITNNQYTIALNNLLSKYTVKKIYYGIGIPYDKYKGKAVENNNMTNFICCVNEEKNVTFQYNPLLIKI